MAHSPSRKRPPTLVKMFYRVMFILFGVALASVVEAQADDGRVALLIGNEDYPAEVGPLQNPHEDVDRVALALATARFSPDNIIIVKDGTQQDMLAGVAQFTAKLKAAGPDGVGFFYYSGHGGSTEIAGQRENYLLPSKTMITTGDQLPILGVPMTGIIKSLSSVDTGNIFVISDACRNTLPITSTKSVGGAAGDKSFAPVPMRPGLFIAYATADGDTAPDDGLFAKTIAEEIAKPAQTASRAFELAFREVAAQRPNGALPFVSPGLRQDVCFVSCPDEAPIKVSGPGEASAQELSDWRAALQADTKEAYTGFADRYPDTFLGGEARAMAVLRPTAQEREDARQASGGDASAESIERTLEALESLAQGLAGVARLGGLIEPATSVTDFYNNAQVYQRRGDTLNARRMYEKAIAEGGAFVDLHVEYVDILKAQEGLIGAREIYADLARRYSDQPAVLLAHAGVLPAAVRPARLDEIAASHPRFGPVHYEIARLYSLDRLGVQTNAEKSTEEAALRAFVSADASGEVERHFLEKELLGDWRDSAARRLAVYDKAASIIAVSFSTMISNSGWMLNATIMEPVTAIYFNTSDTDGFEKTSAMNMNDPRTGQPMQSPFTTLDVA
ncbi:MAG: caspase family protein, partial [Pseudomonadota bacterium]